MSTVRTGTRFRKKKAADHYDVIVIGSGIGGLANAALLSKLGKKVCVLEQHYTAGGYTHAYEREGYEWDVGVHYIGEVHRPNSTLRRVFDVITDGQLEWAEMDTLYDQVYIGDKAYNFMAGPQNFKEEMKFNFPEESDAIDQYVDLLYETSSKVPKFFAGQALPKTPGTLYNKFRDKVLPDYMFKTTYEVLSGLTQNQELIAVLTGQWGDYGLPPKKAAFIMHAMVAKHYLNGGAYPVGGAARIAETIIPVIQQSGGEVFTYAGVDEVLVKNNKAYGVRLVKGDELYADEIVSCAGLVPTLNKLLPEESVKKNGYDKLVTKVETSSAHLCIYAGFKGSAESLQIPKKNFWLYPHYDHDKAVDDFYASKDMDFPLVYISFPSAKDPQWEDRYPGKSTVEIVTVCKPEWFEKWQGTTWGKRGDEYETLKQELTGRLMAKLYQHMPQLEGALDYVELSTPLSTQWFQWNEGGEIYGIEHDVERFRQSWIHPKTEIKNFYLTGSDVVTAGVGGALMGGVMTSMAMMGLKANKVTELLKKGVSPQAQETEQTV
ncbi:FAD-dependent oxidoreductase [Oleiphilus sp. HI0009]|uniref:phytoene desaturase family protein n=1 Tax=unclassified Oleiphilus TaxID=2631174 RepID=UPI0007C2FD6F|nr:MULTISPECIES: NAD(P)/FAD-dependent oxidoreductase [unclassified Oleiphilus]KZX85628.1 FAD-dependent oxidoreductase [Oleiphilus sp. HI0009]KZY65194.1 FAD-dependent oxidoreductase [Oleiphilus sp. HI0066]KZY77415.1 FAD-dependent oxidoreductase [Oleiphilus sp. HI0067]